MHNVSKILIHQWTSTNDTAYIYAVHLKKYTYVLHFFVIRYRPSLPISASTSSYAPMQSSDCPSTSVTTMMDVGKCIHKKWYYMYHHNKITFPYAWAITFLFVNSHFTTSIVVAMVTSNSETVWEYYRSPTMIWPISKFVHYVCTCVVKF